MRSTLPDYQYIHIIRQRIVYTICTIIYKCVHGTAPSCLAEMWIPVAASTGRHNLRSATRWRSVGA